MCGHLSLDFLLTFGAMPKVRRKKENYIQPQKPKKNTFPKIVSSYNNFNYLGQLFTNFTKVSLRNSIPHHLVTEIQTIFLSGNFSLRSSYCSLLMRSTLLKTNILSCLAPISSRILSTTSIFSYRNGSETSTTWSNKSLSILSSKVDENALINCGGRSRINPIVSFNNISLPCHVSGLVMRKRLPTCVHKVANNLFSASTHLPVRKFKRDDLPTFVYPTIPIVSIPFFLLPSL